MAACTIQGTLGNKTMTVTSCETGKLLEASNLLLALARLETGLMGADQSWISRGGRVCDILPISCAFSCAASDQYQTGASPKDYLWAVGTREQKAVQCLKPAKQIALFCGPKLYEPDIGKKLDALACYQQVVSSLIPNDTTVVNPYLWHDALHDDNIFVDPAKPENITGIIDWQSCHISPLFNHNPDPAFIDWDGLEPETLDLAPRPILSELSPEDQATAMHKYTVQNVFIGWRKLMQAKNPALHRVTEFRKTPAYGLIFLAHRMFEYGETHFQSVLLDLKDSWPSLPAVTSNAPFPFNFSEADIARIKRDSDAAVAGSDLLSKAKESLGDLWPDKGFIEQERYNDCKAALDELKGQMIEQLAENDEERAEYERY